MRKGGAAEDRRNTLICFGIIALLLVIIFWALPKKANYTNLWDKVNKLEELHKGAE